MEERKHQRKKEGCVIHLKRSRRKFRKERRGASLGEEEMKATRKKENEKENTTEKGKEREKEINIKIFSKRNTSIPNMHAYSLGPVITQPLTETPSSRHRTGTSRHYSSGAARPPERIRGNGHLVARCRDKCNNNRNQSLPGTSS